VESNDSLRVGLVEMGQQALARLMRAGDSPTASSTGHNLELLERQVGVAAVQTPAWTAASTKWLVAWTRCKTHRSA
jgi:hypothetical protein